MRVFLFGSSFGLATGFILRFRDKIATVNALGYFSSRHTRSYALWGAGFMFVMFPILSCMNVTYDVSGANDSITFLFPAILNLWFALSASAGISFCISMLFGRKIHPHDIVYSSFAVNN
jgi:hypothetical protein